LCEIRVLCGFPQVRHFPQRFAPSVFSTCYVRKILDTPSPLRINFANR
jgi:hypothetical protein